MKRRMKTANDAAAYAIGAGLAETTTLPKNLKPESALSMLTSRATKKGKRLVAWRYDPKTGRAAFRLG